MEGVVFPLYLFLCPVFFLKVILKSDAKTLEKICDKH